MKPKGKTVVATLFRNGGSQAVRLPRAFQFKGDRVRVRRMGKGVLLEPMPVDVEEWLATLAEFRDEPFMPEGRNQPKMPRPRTMFP